MIRDKNLSDLSIDNLVSRYIDLCLRREQAELVDRIAEQNRHIKSIWAVEAELEARHGDQRRALLRLFDHPNMQVRVQAACCVSYFAPETARPLLTMIAKFAIAPMSYQARERLMFMDKEFTLP